MNNKPTLNAFASLPQKSHIQVRSALQSLLSTNEKDTKLHSCRAAASAVTMHLPLSIPDFSDFSLSINHALNASGAVTGTRSLPPGFKHFPIGYAGRCSSIVVSGTKYRRPLGQYWDRSGAEPKVVFGASKAVDFELEVGCVIGAASEFGTPVKAEEAMERVFGFVLVNDWSGTWYLGVVASLILFSSGYSGS
jgi:fumarylacetoacetase